MYVDQVREIGDFQLRNIPRAPSLPTSLQHEIIPLLYHGGSHDNLLENEVFSLRLPDLINYSTGTLRFNTRKALCSAFRISIDAEIMLSGVNTDRRIEPWWGLGEKRIQIIQGLVALGIKFVTAPNFSVVLDHPRFDNMHSIKRIGLVFSEFQNAGMPCALHPNGRTEHDFARWSQFIESRDEVRLLSYEFTTGTARKCRIEFHIEQLNKIADNAGRELDIVIFGNPRVIPRLQNSFRKVVYIETTSFMKSIKRQRAVRMNNDALHWTPAPTEVGEGVDDLFKYNFEERELYLKSMYYNNNNPFSEAA